MIKGSVMNEFDRDRFGDALKKFRDGKPFKTLATETGVDPLTLVRFENGSQIKNPNAFIKLCRVMGKSVTDFPKPKVVVPEFPYPLSRGQWQSLMQLYEFRDNEYTRESCIGSHKTVTNLARLGLLSAVNLSFHRVPYVRITPVGIKYYQLNYPLYQLRYPELHGYSLPKATTTQLHAVVAVSV